jgi:hypothetical protein
MVASNAGTSDFFMSVKIDVFSGKISPDLIFVETGKGLVFLSKKCAKVRVYRVWFSVFRV